MSTKRPLQLYFLLTPETRLAEYQELTSKLHELEAKEHELMEQLNALQQQQQPPEAPEESVAEQPHYQNQTQILQQQRQLARIHGGVGTGTDLTDSGLGGSNPASQCGTLTRQPKILLRAHLPNQQRTSVEVVAGVRLCDALMKALKLRQLTPDMCEVSTSSSGRHIIPWHTDIGSLHVEEIFVRLLEKFPIRTHTQHQFIRKTFFSLVFCEGCRRLLFTGFYCSQCNFRFHQRCAGRVPMLCQPFPMDSYYQLLLAENPDNGLAGFPAAALPYAST